MAPKSSNNFATGFQFFVGTRSIGYLTKLLTPTFNINNFEESFSNWDFEPSRYERDNTTRLPDPVKIAILMSETTGQLQQHLHLNARAAPTHAEARSIMMECYRTQDCNCFQQVATATAILKRLNKPPRWTSTNGHRSTPHKGKVPRQRQVETILQRQRKEQQGKGYNNTNYTLYMTGKGKGKIGQGMPLKGMSNNTGFKGKGKPYNKGTAPTQGCYRCGQQGHIAKYCRVGVCHLNETSNNEAYHDATDQWYQQQPNYDAHWWHSGRTMTNALPQSQPQMALPAPPQHQQDMTPILHIGAIRATPQSSYNKEMPNIQQVPEEEDLMVDSGAAGVQYGLQHSSRHTTFTHYKPHSSGQQQKIPSMCMGTSGCT